jgi:hypothetical protein
LLSFLLLWKCDRISGCRLCKWLAWNLVQIIMYLQPLMKSVGKSWQCTFSGGVDEVSG